VGFVYALQREGTIGRKSPHVKDIQVANAKGQAKPTHQNIIRLAPPLVITEKEIDSALAIIKEAIEELPGLKGEREAEIPPPGEKNVRISVDN